MLKQRVLTAIVSLPLLLALLLFGPAWAVIPFFLLLVGFATYETAHMLVPRLEFVFREGSFKEGRNTDSGKWVVAVAVVLSCLMFLVSSAGSEMAAKGIIVVSFLSSMLLGCFCSADINVGFGRIAGLLIAISYGFFPWLAVWGLLQFGENARYVLLLLAIVWSGDTGAYFCGRYFGKRKLAPRMSPNKTVEGAIGGLASSVVGGLIINAVYGGALASWAMILVVSLVGGALGQMGDLVESCLKRFSGVKDSGVIFPGHGGVLDRVDGLLFAAPAIWFILYTL